MANFLQQLRLGGTTYDFYDSEFIIDTRSASGAALTGISKAPALFDGMQITFWMNYAAASNATLNLTLADGSTTGAIPCYYSGTTRLGTNYAAGNAVHFTYRANVTIGSTTIAQGWWADAGSSGPDTPTTDGNYVLNVDSGNSSWGSVIYTINIERHSGEDTWTLLNDSDEAYSEVAAYVVGGGSTRRPIQFRTIEDGGDAVGVYTGFFQFDFFPVVGGYFYKVNPTLQYSSPYLINPLIHDGWMIAWSMLDHSSPIVLLPFSRDIVTSDLLSSSSVLSSASLSGGTTPTITYSAATASKATLTNGLLSFGDVSASNITNWSAGSMPTISTNTITVVTPASS